MCNQFLLSSGLRGYKLVYFCVLKVFLKKNILFLFFYFKLIFLIFLDHFDVLILKIIFFK